jgi:hypothetical protein
MKADIARTGTGGTRPTGIRYRAPAADTRSQGLRVPGEDPARNQHRYRDRAFRSLVGGNPFGWIKDLFLLTPEKVLTSFWQAWSGDIQAAGRSICIGACFASAAFGLACVTAVPPVSPWACRGSPAAL